MDAKLLHDMFDLTLPVAEKILRPILVYAFLVIGLRLAGKRELAQLNAFDLVVLLTLSNTVQNAIIGDDNSVSGGIIGATTLLAVNYWVVRFLYGHQKLEALVEGASTVLVENGKVVEANLRHELITIQELEVAAHKQGLSSLGEVDCAVLETGGTISFSARKPSIEATRHAELLARVDALAEELKALSTHSRSIVPE